MKKENTLFSLVFFAIYMMIFVVALKTPMHSDDFSYSFLGLNPNDHINHYMAWSGRLVADYISTIILSFNNHYFIASLNSLGSTLLIYNIAKLPSASTGENNKLKTSTIAIFAFLVYWCGNPNLGQVMFWVVGTANYTWTTLIVIYFLRKIIESKVAGNEPSNKTVMLFFVLGIISGCSNENTGTTLVLILITLSLYYKLTTGVIGLATLSGLIGVTLGAATLILAPGNYVRANLPLLEDWRMASFSTKFFKFLLKTIPDVISHDWLVLIAIVFICISLLIAKADCKNYLLVIIGAAIFFLVSNVVMFASPWYPPRAMNTQFIFLVCLASTLLCALPTKYFYKLSSSLIILLMMIFIPTYGSTFTAYSHAYEQSKIRVSIIKNAKKNGHESVNIPLYYFRWLPNLGYMFDTWHSNAIAKYYGLKNVSASPIQFDYSVVNDKCAYTPDLTVTGNSSKCIFTYYDKFSSETFFIVEFEKKIDPASIPDMRLFIKPILSDGTMITRNTGFPFQTSAVGKRNFTFIKIPNIKPGDVKSINFGYYSSKLGTNFATQNLVNAQYIN
ncbi:DUF3329 domain-containing protein [Enterobacter ludwigii]